MQRRMFLGGAAGPLATAAAMPLAALAAPGRRSMNSRGAWLSTLASALCWAGVGLFAPARAATDGLSGTLWQLMQFQSSDGQTLTAESGSPFTIEFRADNTVAVHLDCHRGRGTWISRSTSQLELGPLAFTRAACQQTPLRNQVAQQWTSIRSYTLRDMHLFLVAGSGTYEFEPANGVAAQATHGVTGQSTNVPAPPAPPTSWLDESKPVSWNGPDAKIPAAPRLTGATDPRCGGLARTPELEADKRLAELGWSLVGPYQGGWGILVIQAAAGYDGMCRPQSYQAFVFLHGVFAGTLAPQTMDARADGALDGVTLRDDRRLVAQYARYAAADALCCPSRTASVVFQIARDAGVVQPVSVSTSPNR